MAKANKKAGKPGGGKPKPKAKPKTKTVATINPLRTLAPAAVTDVDAELSIDGMGQVVAAVEATILLSTNDVIQSVQVRVTGPSGVDFTENLAQDPGNSSLWNVTGIGAGVLQPGETYFFEVTITYDMTFTGLKTSGSDTATAPV